MVGKGKQEKVEGNLYLKEGDGMILKLGNF